MFLLKKYSPIILLLIFLIINASAPGSPASDSGIPGIEQTKKTGGRVIPLITVFGSSEGPKFETRVLPEYPFAARKRGQEGKVVLRLFIDELGILQSVEVLEATDPIFIQPAVTSVKRSFFIPAKNNNRPVSSKAELPICFTIKK